MADQNMLCHHDQVDFIFPMFEPTDGPNKEVYWISDFQEVHLPHLFSEEEKNYRYAKNKAISEQDAIVILSSQSALEDFKALFPEAKARPRCWQFCTVLTEEEQGGADPFSKYNLASNYLYLPNQFWVHKDHLTVFKALLDLKKTNVSISLVCTGYEQDYRNLDHINMLKDFVQSEGLEKDVKFLGVVSRADQIEIFRHAQCVVQPSLFEGWSTVVEDCKAVGCPIILSDIPVHIEQAPLRGQYFKAGDCDDLAQKLKSFLSGPKPYSGGEEEKKLENQANLREKNTGESF
ncbi:glycosyltransferase, partial [Curvivirga aplysinae]|uniref:glycosyltransferase n=1 Tax=Curvivirga aplysinae TaxID=2529852 RepID=UPI001C3F51AA